MVQSASIEDGISRQQQLVRCAKVEYRLVVVGYNLHCSPLKVPFEDPDIQSESPRVPLPPPIIPETEDSTPSPVSETSSGYISNSISTATLSDVYTLSWDLPPPCSRKIDGFEALPDTEEESLVADPQPLSRESLLVWEKGAEERKPSRAGAAAPDPTSSSQEANLCTTSQLRLQEPPPQTEHEPDSDTKENQTDQINTPQEAAKEETSQAQGHDLHAADETDRLSQEEVPQTQPGQDQTPFGGAQDPTLNQIGEDPQVLILTPASSGEQVYLDGARTQTTPGVPNSDCIPGLAPANDEAPADASRNAPAAAAQSSVQPSKPSPSGTNPFKIQKVKSSDLKSFQPILGTDETASPQVDHANSLGVPLENLEIISDCEEGDTAAAVLPDWLKEGEFVTVGGNKSGTVRYVGPTDFAEGTWVGVELEAPAGE